MTPAGAPPYPVSPGPIHHDVLLVVEGKAMVGFFYGLLAHLRLSERIGILDFGGKDQFAGYVKALTMVTGFDKVSALGLVRDTEGNPKGMFDSMKGALRAADLPVPKKTLQVASGPPATAICLIPDATTKGMLETLCWRAFVERADPAVACVDGFLDCVAKESGKRLPNPDKSRVYAYLSVQKKPDQLLGQFSRGSNFPWDAKAFDELKTFVGTLVAQASP